MDDKTLLEKAAKAAGMHDIEWHDSQGGYIHDWDTGNAWNPLSSDADALRLAVKMGIDIIVSVERPARSAACPPAGLGYLCEDHGSDPYAATRRAIVRAAAELA